LFSRFPDGGVRLRAHHLWQSRLSQSPAKLRALSVTRIRSYHSHGNQPLDRLPNLLHRHLWLGWKGHSFRDPLPADTIATMADSNSRCSPTNRRLAVRRLAQLPAGLPGNPHRMLPLLRKSRVVEDPRYYRTVLLHGWEHLLPHVLQHTAHRPPSDAATDACAAHGPEPSAPPTARHSCALRATAVLCRSSSTACADRHAPRFGPGLHMCREALLLWAWR
jgi:hypothetical protein